MVRPLAYADRQELVGLLRRRHDAQVLQRGKCSVDEFQLVRRQIELVEALEQVPDDPALIGRAGLDSSSLPYSS